MRVPLRAFQRCIGAAIFFGAALSLSGCLMPPARVPAPGHMAIPTKDSTDHSSVIPVPETSSAVTTTTRANALYAGTGQLTANAIGDAAAPTRALAADNGIQLAFSDVDISQVVGSVVGEALGLNYSIDPSVKGTMSLRSTRPLSPEELLPALESALRIQDLALVRVKDTYHIVPLKEAARRVTSINPPSDRNQPGFAIEVVQIGRAHV